MTSKRVHGLAALVASFFIGCTAPERIGPRVISDISRNDAGSVSAQQVVGIVHEEGTEKSKKFVERARFTWTGPADKLDQYAGALMLPLPDIAKVHVEVLGHGRTDEQDNYRTGAGLLASYPIGNGKAGLQFLGQTAEQNRSTSTLLDSAATYEIDKALRVQLGGMITCAENKDNIFDVRGSVVGQYHRLVIGAGARSDLDWQPARRRVVLSLVNLPEKKGEGLGFRVLYHSNYAGSTRILLEAGLFNVSTAQTVLGLLSAGAVNEAGPLVISPGNDMNAIPPTFFAHTGPDFPVSNTAEARVNISVAGHIYRVIPEVNLYPFDIARRLMGSPMLPVLNAVFVGGGPSIVHYRSNHTNIGDYVHIGFRPSYGLTLMIEKDRKDIAGRLTLDVLSLVDALK